MLSDWFRGYGQEPTDARIKLYGNATGYVPAGFWYRNDQLVDYVEADNLLARALVKAAQDKANGFMPTPGELFEACKQLGQTVKRYSATSGTTYDEPEWLQVQRRKNAQLEARKQIADRNADLHTSVPVQGDVF